MTSRRVKPGGLLPVPSAETDCSVGFVVNGVEHRLSLDTRVTLLNALRGHLALTGTRKGCDLGGVRGLHGPTRRQARAVVPGAGSQCDGREVTTIEGLASDGRLHPLQKAFICDDAVQCGYCTSGHIMSAVALLKEGRGGCDEEIREFMSGNPQGTARECCQDELNCSEDAAVEAAIRVHEWVQSEFLWLAKAIRDLEHGPSAPQEHHTDSYAKEGVS